MNRPQNLGDVSSQFRILLLIITSNNTSRNFSFGTLQEDLQMKMKKMQMLSISVKTEYEKINSIMYYSCFLVWKKKCFWKLTSESYTDIDIFPLKNRVVGLIVSYLVDSTEVTCQIQSIIVFLDCSISFTEFSLCYFCPDFFIEKIATKSFFCEFLMNIFWHQNIHLLGLI